MSDDFYGDGFHSGEESDGNETTQKSGLVPIVEVPSETSSHIDTGRSDDPEQDHDQFNSDHHSEEDSEDDENESPATKTSARGRGRSHKARVRNGKYNTDVTPPDKLLRRAERKANRYIEKKNGDKAIRGLVRCTALARIVHGDGHFKLAKVYAYLAQAYLELKGYAPQAHYHATFAKNIMDNNVHMSSSGTDSTSILDIRLTIYHTLGRACTILKKYTEADASLNDARRIKLPSDQQVEWDIKINLALAKLYAKQQKFALATTYFEKVLGGLEKKHGRDSIKLIPVYQGLGRVELSKGDQADAEQAIQHFLQAHSIAAARYKSGSVEVADTACCLATAYASIGGDDADVSAESYMNDCQAIYLTVYGPHNEKTLEVEDGIARLMIRTDRQEEAIQMLKSTMDAKKEVYGDLSPEVADTWKLIGNVYLALGDSERALRALKKCHNVQCSVYGSNNKKSKDTQRTIDLLLANPTLASKQKKTKADELKERPRFSSIVSRTSTVGGFKAAAY